MTAVLFSTFLFTMAVGVPIAITLGLATLVAVVWDGRFSAMLIPQKFFAGLDSFPLLAIPFFILAAEMMSGGRLTEVLLRFASACVGHIRGGLGHANILTMTFFSGISGSALADAAGPGSLITKMMRQTGYHPAICRGDDGFGRHRRADHPAVDHHGRLCADRQQRERHGPVPCGHRAWPDDRGGAPRREPLDLGASQLSCRRGASFAPRIRADRLARASRPHAAVHHPRRNPYRRLHADGGFGGRGVLRLGGGALHLPHADARQDPGHPRAHSGHDGLGHADHLDVGGIRLGADGAADPAGRVANSSSRSASAPSASSWRSTSSSCCSASSWSRCRES